MQSTKVMLTTLAMSGLVAGAAVRLHAGADNRSTSANAATVQMTKLVLGRNVDAGRLADSPDGTKKDKNTCKGKDGCPGAGDSKSDGSKVDKSKGGDSASGDGSTKQKSAK